MAVDSYLGGLFDKDVDRRKQGESLQLNLTWVSQRIFLIEFHIYLCGQLETKVPGIANIVV